MYTASLVLSGEKELAAPGRNLKRLAEVKAKYDPENFFRVNNNILPAK